MCACREAQIEQRMARREAAKERDQSPELLKLPGGGDIMGGDDSFSSAKARWRCERAAHAQCRQTFHLATRWMLILSSKRMLWGLRCRLAKVGASVRPWQSLHQLGICSLSLTTTWQPGHHSGMIPYGC